MKEKLYHVYVPVMHSEIYVVSATSPEDAIKQYENNPDMQLCLGEVTTQKEHLGIRAVPIDELA